MLDNETITFRVTEIDVQSYPDDYTVTWRGLRIGRIRKSPGLPAHVDQWSWGCNVYGNHRAEAIADRAPIWRIARPSSKSPRHRKALG
jgi:hypothetical protein